mgnify:CR=1 FL=1
MKACPRCATQNLDTANYCMSCGSFFFYANAKTMELKKATRRELEEFLTEDPTNDFDYAYSFEKHRLIFRLMANAARKRIRTALVVVEYEFIWGNWLYEDAANLMVGAELHDGRRAYFSLENDMLYDSAEELISSWEGVSEVKLHDEMWYWFS